jgi:hypothetical protein
MTSKNEALLSFGIIAGVIRALEPDLTESIHKALMQHCEIVTRYLMHEENPFTAPTIPWGTASTLLGGPGPIPDDSPWPPGSVPCGGNND